MRNLLVSLLFVAACGSSEPPNPDSRNASTDGRLAVDGVPSGDGAPSVDGAAAVPVEVVDCAAVTPNVTAVWSENGQTPSAVTVKQGQILRVDAPGHSYWESGGAWNGGDTTCLRLNTAATYSTFCYLHGNEAAGTVVVTP